MNRQNDSFIPTNPLRPKPAENGLTFNNRGKQLGRCFAPLKITNPEYTSTLRDVRNYYDWHQDRHYTPIPSNGVHIGMMQMYDAEREAEDFDGELSNEVLQQLDSNGGQNDELKSKFDSMITRIGSMGVDQATKDNLMNQVYKLEMFKPIIANLPLILDPETGKPILNPATIMNLVGSNSSSSVNSNQQSSVNINNQNNQINRYPTTYSKPVVLEHIEGTPLKDVGMAMRDPTDSLIEGIITSGVTPPKKPTKKKDGISIDLSQYEKNKRNNPDYEYESDTTMRRSQVPQYEDEESGYETEETVRRSNQGNVQVQAKKPTKPKNRKEMSRKQSEKAKKMNAKKGNTKK